MVGYRHSRIDGQGNDFDGKIQDFQSGACDLPHDYIDVLYSQFYHFPLFTQIVQTLGEEPLMGMVACHHCSFLARACIANHSCGTKNRFHSETVFCAKTRNCIFKAVKVGIQPSALPVYVLCTIM